jgi:hypothetical protein
MLINIFSKRFNKYSKNTFWQVRISWFGHGWFDFLSFIFSFVQQFVKFYLSLLEYKIPFGKSEFPGLGRADLIFFHLFWWKAADLRRPPQGKEIWRRASFPLIIIKKNSKLFYIYDIVITKLSKVLVLVTKLSYNMTLPVCHTWP